MYAPHFYVAEVTGPKLDIRRIVSEGAGVGKRRLLWPFRAYDIRLYSCNLAGTSVQPPNLSFLAAVTLGNVSSQPFTVDETVFSPEALQRGEEVYENGCRRILGSYGVAPKYLEFSGEPRWFGFSQHLAGMDYSPYGLGVGRVSSGNPSIMGDNTVMFMASNVVADPKSSCTLTYHVMFSRNGDEEPYVFPRIVDSPVVHIDAFERRDGGRGFSATCYAVFGRLRRDRIKIDVEFSSSDPVVPEKDNVRALTAAILKRIRETLPLEQRGESSK
jgi:hypothetical protein